jgi:hypothetical protein
MKYTVEMGSGAMIYIPSFRHSKVDKELYKYTDTHRARRPH